MEWLYILLEICIRRQLHFPTLVLTRSGSKGSKCEFCLSQTAPLVDFYYSKYILFHFVIKVKLFMTRKDDNG